MSFCLSIGGGKRTRIGSSSTKSTATVLQIVVRSHNYSRCRGFEITGRFVFLIRLLFDYNLSVSILLNYRADNEVLDGSK